MNTNEQKEYMIREMKCTYNSIERNQRSFLNSILLEIQECSNRKVDLEKLEGRISKAFKKQEYVLK